MFFSRTCLSLIFIAVTSADASPVSRSTGKSTLSLAARFNLRAGLSIVERDRIRLRALQAGDHGAHSPPQVDITNRAFAYTAEVWVGKPPTNYTLIVDTGSANTWVGANKTYVPTNTSQDTGKSFHVEYGSGNVTGEEWIDTVMLGPNLVVHQQSIGVAHTSQGLAGLDGIIGLGPVNSTKKTVGNSTETVPTVMNNLFSQRVISKEVFGAYFVPSPVTEKTGELTFGGYDESAIVEAVNYVPLTHHKNLSHYYWGIDQTISYGPDIIMQSGSGIIDTGSTLIYITPDALEIYINKTGATYDNATALYSITAAQYDNLEPLVFHIGHVAYELIPNAQIWPRSLNTVINGTSDAIYLLVATHENLPFDFVNGLAFLERFYSVYDTTHGRVGFAKTQYTCADIN